MDAAVDTDVEMTVAPDHGGLTLDASYTEVPREEWDKIPQNTYIRYLVNTSAENPSRSGFVKGIRMIQSKAPSGEQQNRYQFQMISDLNRRTATHWLQNFDTIAQLWRKVSQVVDITPHGTSGGDGGATETNETDGMIVDSRDRPMPESLSELQKKIDTLESKSKSQDNDIKILQEAIRDLNIRNVRIIELLRKMDDHIVRTR